MILKKYHDILCRLDNDSDKLMIKECEKNYKDFNFEDGDVILDMGAHIGGFAHQVLKNRISCKYIGFEADDDNFSVLCKNIRQDERATIFNRAISHYPTGAKLVFYQNESKRAKVSGTVNPSIPGQRKIRTEVLNFNINDMLEDYQPNKVKVDIEGAEWPWLKEIKGKLPSYIKEIALELHGYKNILENQRYIDNILKYYDIIYIGENSGYITKDPNKELWDLSKYGLSNTKRTSTLFGVDIFLRRK